MKSLKKLLIKKLEKKTTTKKKNEAKIWQEKTQ
jgi:hypothetical protein